MLFRSGNMFDKIYIAGWDDIKAGDICYGSKGEPLEYIERASALQGEPEADLIRLKTVNGKVRTDISNIKLVKHDNYHSFRWTTAPGERITSAAVKGITIILGNRSLSGSGMTPFESRILTGCGSTKKSITAVVSKYRSLTYCPLYG